MLVRTSGAGVSDALRPAERPERDRFIGVRSSSAVSEYPGRFDWTWVPIIGLGMLDAVLARHLGMRFVGWERFGLWTSVPAAVAVFYGISRRSDRLVDVGYYTMLWLLFSLFGCILTYLAARADLPLRDTQFTHYDALLRFDWCKWVTFVGSHKKFELLLALAYSTILPQTVGSIIYFSHIRRPDRNNDFLWTTMVAGLMTCVISGLLPARGPHLEGQHFEWWTIQNVLRGGSCATFSLERLQGIVVLPSFHTVTAILLI